MREWILPTTIWLLTWYSFSSPFIGGKYTLEKLYTKSIHENVNKSIDVNDVGIFPIIKRKQQ